MSICGTNPSGPWPLYDHGSAPGFASGCRLSPRFPHSSVSIAFQSQPLQSAVSPQRDSSSPAPANATNTDDLTFLARDNTTNSVKLPGAVVRDEEVVGSNPATPTYERP